MERASWTYFILLGLSLLYPLAQSFESRICMYRRVKFILPGILATGLIYIAWDVWFTRAGIWGFNHNYIRDISLFGLPMEEVLFFLVVPYCCIFLYEVLRYFIKSFHYPLLSKYVIYGLLALFTGLVPLVYDRTYTVTALSFTSLMLVLQLVQKTYLTWFSWFMLTYLVSLVPFMIVNGFLTAIPVVWYDNAETLGLRIFTIPLDDFIYLMGLLLPSVNIYQLLLHRHASRFPGGGMSERESGS
ncbi:MAG: lycopene cyclase domain-containing protein [Bacteroidetes bacterium]|nr:MAG: lycopene cyclase domain-containing protein [Bacteroidota bacterium]